MYTPLPIVEGDCIDNDYLIALYENLDYFNNCLSLNSLKLTCQSLARRGTQPLRRVSGNPLCFSIQSPDPLINASSLGTDLVKKLLIFEADYLIDAIYNDSDNPGQTTVSREVSITCNGETIAVVTGGQSITPLTFVDFECPPNSEVQLCFDVSQSNSGSAILQANSTFTVSFCGSLICFDQISSTAGTSGYLQPPPINPDCCYGREAIHLALQNLAALTESFSSAGQIPRCERFIFNDGDDHVLLNTATSCTTFLVMGNASVSGQNASTSSPATINVQPRFSCASTENRCNAASANLPAAEGNGPTTGFATANIVLCGKCDVGDTLSVGLRSELVCNETPSQIITGANTEITGINQNYCVYFFEDLNIDFGDGINSSLGRCIDVSVFDLIHQRMEAMNNACSNQSNVEFSNDAASGTAGRGDCVVVKPPEPWPPLNDPTNTNPPPTRKYYMLASISPSTQTVGGLNAEDYRLVQANAEVFCGGNLVDFGISRWVLTSSGGLFQNGPPIRFSQCIECPVDQPIEFCFDSTQLAGFGGLPDTFNWFVRFFSFF